MPWRPPTAGFPDTTLNYPPGVDFDLSDDQLAVLLEEVGHHVAPVPFLPAVLAIEAFRHAHRAAKAEPLLSGEHTACVAMVAGADAVRALLDRGATSGALELAVEYGDVSIAASTTKTWGSDASKRVMASAP